MLFIFSLFKDCLKPKEETEYTVKNLREIFKNSEEEEERFYRKFAKTYAFRKNRPVNVDTSGEMYYRIR